MSLNLETKETHWYVDENWVMRMKADADGNKHDSIEQTYHAFCAYSDYLFIEGVMQCLTSNPPRRYPVKYAGMQPMSRDHILFGLSAILESGYDRNKISDFIPKFIFDKGNGSYMNLQMWLWTKLITDKKIGKLFYLVALFQAVKNSLWNQMLNKIFDYDNLEDNIFWHNDSIEYDYNKTKALLYYPVYAIKLVATMLQYVPKNWFTKQIKKQLLKITPDKNFAIKIMLGDKSVKYNDVIYFRPIDKPRWSQMINPMRNNRKFRYLTEEEMAFNCVDYDYLQWLWNKREYFYE